MRWFVPIEVYVFVTIASNIEMCKYIEVDLFHNLSHFDLISEYLVYITNKEKGTILEIACGSKHVVV